MKNMNRIQLILVTVLLICSCGKESRIVVSPSQLELDCNEHEFVVRVIEDNELSYGFCKPNQIVGNSYDWDKQRIDDDRSAFSIQAWAYPYDLKIYNESWIHVEFPNHDLCEMIVHIDKNDTDNDRAAYFQYFPETISPLHHSTSVKILQRKKSQ